LTNEAMFKCPTLNPFKDCKNVMLFSHFVCGIIFSMEQLGSFGSVSEILL
jgi:hypothetical protein